MRYFLGLILICAAFVQSAVGQTTVSPKTTIAPKTTLSASGGSGATSFVYVTGSVTGCAGEGSRTSCPYALHSNPVAGQLMVVGVFFDNSSGATTATFSCTNNGTFTQAGSFLAGTGGLAGGFQGMFYQLLTSSGADTCTLTPNASANLVWESAQYTFSGTFTGLDGAATFAQVTASANVATITATGPTSGTSDLVVATTINNSNGVTTTPGTGYTFRDDTSACEWFGSSCSTVGFNAYTGAGYEDKVNVAAGTPVATFNTVGATDLADIGLVSFH